MRVKLSVYAPLKHGFSRKYAKNLVACVDFFVYIYGHRQISLFIIGRQLSQGVDIAHRKKITTLTNIFFLFRLSKLRRWHNSNAKSMDDAIVEAWREAILFRNIFQGKHLSDLCNVRIL